VAEELPSVFGIDRDVHAQAGMQRDTVERRVIELQPHRHALNHLDPIAGRILRRQQRELRSGART